MATDGLLLLEPKELVFQAVKFHQAHNQTVRLHNTSKAPIEGELRTSSSDRYTINPSSFRLRSGDAQDITITLKLGNSFAQTRKAVTVGQRDPFLVKTTFFDQRFYSTFFLHPDECKHSGGPGGCSSKLQRNISMLSPQKADNESAAAAIQSFSRSRSLSSPLANGAADADGRTSTVVRKAGKYSPQTSSRQSTAMDSNAAHQQQNIATGNRQQHASSGAVKDGCSMAQGADLEVAAKSARPVRKSVSFADLPTWRPSCSSETDAVGSAITKTTSQPRRASDSETLGQPAGRDGSNSGNSSRRSASSISWGTTAEAAHASSSGAAAVSSAAVFGPALQSWRQSVRAHRQQEPTDPLAASEIVRPYQALMQQCNSGPAAQVAEQQQAASQAKQPAGETLFAEKQSARPLISNQEGPVLSHPAAHHNTGLTSVSNNAEPHLAAAASSDPSLQQQVQELQQALTAATAELEASKLLTAELLQGKPDAALLVETGAKREQAVQEERNRRALELLLAKDATIKQLQARCEAAEAELAQQQNQQQQSQQQQIQEQQARDAAVAAAAAAASEQRAAAAEVAQHELLAALQQLQEQHMHELETSIRGHSQQVQALEEQLATHKHQLLQAQQEVLQLSCELAQTQQDLEHFTVAAHNAPNIASNTTRNSTIQAGTTDTGTAVAASKGAVAANTTDPATIQSGINNSKAKPAQDQGTDAHLLQVLAERDAELATAQAELAVAKAALAGQADVPGETGAVAQVVLLQHQVAELSASLRASQQRLADVEALQALAAAAAEEGELLAAEQQCCAGAARREASKQQHDADVARVTAARLNARVTELAGELHVAQQEVQGLQQQLKTQHELHERDSRALQQKLAALVAAGGPHLSAFDQEYDALHLPDNNSCLNSQQQLRLQLPHPSAGSSALQGSQAGSCAAAGVDAADREQYMALALEDAEAAVALLQARLVEAKHEQRLCAARLADMTDRSTSAAVRHAQQLSVARQAGQTQLTALQDSMTRLGNARGELGTEVCCGSCTQIALLDLIKAGLSHTETHKQPVHTVC
eukprot:GHRR01014538.1.p1 GENE.GHRR01014538.1~~GHRR01014538.1.p1  ORF type:complete len:1054 (+),score=521.99 GHRR01014538.1:348-3509(+)